MSRISDIVSSIQDEERRLVEIPEWTPKGEPVLTIEMRSMPLAERNALAKECRDKKTGALDVQKYYPRLIIAISYDPETGEKAFSMRDIPMLEGKNGKVTDRLATIGMQLVGMIAEEEKDDDELDEERGIDPELPEEEKRELRAQAMADEQVQEAGKDSSSAASSEPVSSSLSASAAPSLS